MAIEGSLHIKLVVFITKLITVSAQYNKINMRFL